MTPRAETVRSTRIGLIDRLRAAMSGPARVQLGLALIAQGREAEGFRHLAQGARRGLAEAQHQVGRCYLAGLGVPRNYTEAAHWLELAARQNHHGAQAQLAMLLFEGFGPAEGGLSTATAQPPDPAMGLYWARCAAQSGEADAQALLGYILTVGPETVRDLDQAENWYRRSAESGCPQGALGYGLARLRAAADEAERREAAGQIAKAAEAGLPTAIHLLATLIADGHGLARDEKAAATLYKQAAEMGVTASCTRWGVALMEGRGTTRDVSLAEFWLRRAALDGDAEAATRLGALYTQGGEVPPNFFEAAHWLEQGAARGQAEAARMLGQLYLSGAGVTRNVERAAEWLQKAMLAGDPQAQADLGNLVLSGEAGTFDKSILLQRYRAEAEAGDPFAAFNYGVCLVRGVGAAPDWPSSIIWLRRASEAVPEARFWIAELLASGGNESHALVESESAPTEPTEERPNEPFEEPTTEPVRFHTLH